MRRAMRKPRDIQFKIFAARLTELNNRLLISRDRAPPIRWTLKRSMRSWYTPSQTLGHDRRTYRDVISRGGPTRKHATCLNACKFQKQSTKEEYLLKILSGQKPTVPVLTGSKSEAEPPRHPTLRRSVLASARETMQGIQAMRGPVRKIHACCMSPGTLPKSAKCYRTIPKSTSCSDHLKTRKPAPAATNTVNFERASEEVNIMKYHDEPIPKTKRGKVKIRNPRVTKTMQIHQRMDAIVDLTVWIWGNLHRTRKMTPNKSSRKVGKSRGGEIEITVSNVNVTYYQIF